MDCDAKIKSYQEEISYCQICLDAIANSSINENMETIEKTRDYIEKQIKDYKKRINDLEARRKKREKRKSVVDKIFFGLLILLIINFIVSRFAIGFDNLTIILSILFSVILLIIMFFKIVDFPKGIKTWYTVAYGLVIVMAIIMIKYASESFLSDTLSYLTIVPVAAAVIERIYTSSKKDM